MCTNIQFNKKINIPIPTLICKGMGIMPLVDFAPKYYCDIILFDEHGYDVYACFPGAAAARLAALSGLTASKKRWPGPAFLM
jgi:hypothetical protein